MSHYYHNKSLPFQDYITVSAELHHILHPEILLAETAQNVINATIEAKVYDNEMAKYVYAVQTGFFKDQQSTQSNTPATTTTTTSPSTTTNTGSGGRFSGMVPDNSSTSTTTTSPEPLPKHPKYNFDTPLPFNTGIAKLFAAANTPPPAIGLPLPPHLANPAQQQQATGHENFKHTHQSVQHLLQLILPGSQLLPFNANTIGMPPRALQRLAKDRVVTARTALAHQPQQSASASSREKMHSKQLKETKRLEDQQRQQTNLDGTGGESNSNSINPNDGDQDMTNDSNTPLNSRMAGFKSGLQQQASSLLTGRNNVSSTLQKYSLSNARNDLQRYMHEYE